MPFCFQVRSSYRTGRYALHKSTFYLLTYLLDRQMSGQQTLHKSTFYLLTYLLDRQMSGQQTQCVLLGTKLRQS